MRLSGDSHEYLHSLFNADDSSNVPQLVVSIFLLRSNQVAVLKTSLIGSILSNMLFMAGLAFFVGGWHRHEQYYNARIMHMLSSLLLLIITALMIPTASQWLANTDTIGILHQSRGTVKNARATITEMAEKKDIGRHREGHGRR